MARSQQAAGDVEAIGMRPKNWLLELRKGEQCGETRQSPIQGSHARL